jgi:DNA-binding NarL/FixJ family response regulator
MPASHPHQNENSVHTSVIVVDARPMAADGMVRAISAARDLVVAGQCVRRDQISAACAAGTPDVAVVDLELYGRDPRAAVEGVHSLPAAARTRILLLCPDFQIERVAAALFAGAQNCISSLAGRAELVRAIRATCAGDLVVPKAWAKELAYRMVEMGRTPATLSAREIEVLRLAAVGLPAQTIANTLCISANTVRTHFQKIYGKLDTHSRSGAVATAIRDGLI